MSQYHPPLHEILHGDKDASSLQELHEAQFEDEVVNHLFSRYKLPGAIKSRMLREYKAKFDHPQLTLEAFHEEFPSFPIHLVARKFPKIRDESPVHKIFMDFANRQYTKAFYKVKESLPEGTETYGLVFHWGYLRATGRQKVDERASALVLHNRMPSSRVPGVWLTWIPPKRQEPLYLQPLATLLTNIDRECPGKLWQPDE